MKLTKILLRWYKSFHLNYRGVVEKGETRMYRPWNSLSPKYAPQEEFPFIEIPLERDISTIVGANESGKSHLLNAIKKVITGTGLKGTADPFERTDLCHYAGVRTRNVDAWPNIGLQFAFETDEEYKALKAALGDILPDATDRPKTFALIIAPDQDGASPAQLYVEPSDKPISLSESLLGKVRSLLPRVEYIDSTAELPGEIPLASLMAGYDSSGQSVALALPSRRAVEQAISIVHALPTLVVQQAVSAGVVQALEQARELVGRTRSAETTSRSMEMRLFKEILDISADTLRYIYELEVDDRGYIEGQIAKWNDEIQDRLNLSHFWSQDEQFTLSVNYKDGVIYFEITDKTGSIYTFNERSSGLRFFLSYYIQAKAMERTARNRNAIVLMDEPDAALSIVGQRNLLGVFESLVSPESSNQTCQLIYTTHSPYLINRNFPRRIRVVKKEDAEQGTQYIEQARARRYEPVRTALGIDSAPSLFLGADNILTEGATDQFLLAELIRVFATPQNVGEFLDLNAVEIVSADGVGNIENVLDQSHWADEPVPPTVVIVDGDKAGRDVIHRIAKARPIIGEAFCTTMSDQVPGFGDNSVVLTTEDIVPKGIYKRAIHAYLKRWLPKSLERDGASVDQVMAAPEFGNGGLVAATQSVFRIVQPELDGDYDKMGVFQEVIASVREALAISTERDPSVPRVAIDDDVDQLKNNLVRICDFIREALSESRAAIEKVSATQAIRRLISDFQRLNKTNVPVTNLQRLVNRLAREVATIGTDGESIQRVLNAYVGELDRLRKAGQERIGDGQWGEWQQRMQRLKDNPLQAALD